MGEAFVSSRAIFRHTSSYVFGDGMTKVVRYSGMPLRIRRVCNIRGGANKGDAFCFVLFFSRKATICGRGLKNSSSRHFCGTCCHAVRGRSRLVNAQDRRFCRRRTLTV